MANQQQDADSEIKQNQPQPNNPKTVPINSVKLGKKVDAFRFLRQAVSEEVHKEAAAIATALIQSVKDGNSNSARIVVSLIDKRARRRRDTKKSKPTPQTPTRSVAMDLAAQPPYTGPDEDGEIPDFFGT